MQTSSCNEYPLTPHFYIVKLGFTGVFIFLIFALKHLCFEQKEEKMSFLYLKLSFFSTFRNCFILHGHVFVMKYNVSSMNYSSHVHALQIIIKLFMRH